MATQDFELEDKTFEGRAYCIRGEVVWDDQTTYAELYSGEGEDLPSSGERPVPIQPQHSIEVAVIETYDEATETWVANPGELARLKDSAALHSFILDILLDEACAAAEQRDEQRRES